MYEVEDVAIEEVKHTAFLHACKGQTYDAATAADLPRPTQREYRYYLPGSVTWSSWPIAHSVLTRATREHAAHLLANVHVAQRAARSILNDMSSDLFEGLVTFMLHSGGTFKMTEAGTASADSEFWNVRSQGIQVDESKTHMSFSSVKELKKLMEDLAGKKSFVLHASNRKKCAIDGIIKTRDGRFILYNATFANKHPIKLSNAAGTGGLIPVAEALGLLTRDAAKPLSLVGGPIDLAFIVPRAQKPRIKNIQSLLVGNVNKDDAATVSAALRQHIIMLPTRMIPLPETTVAPAPAALDAVKARSPTKLTVKSLEEFDKWLAAQELSTEVK